MHDRVALIARASASRECRYGSCHCERWHLSRSRWEGGPDSGASEHTERDDEHDGERLVGNDDLGDHADFDADADADSDSDDCPADIDFDRKTDDGTKRVTASGGGSETTDTPTDTSTGNGDTAEPGGDTPEDETTTSEEGGATVTVGPGFGVLPAIVALLSVCVLVLRRRFDE